MIVGFEHERTYELEGTHLIVPPEYYQTGKYRYVKFGTYNAYVDDVPVDLKEESDKNLRDMYA